MTLKYFRVAKVGDIPPGEYVRVSPQRGEHVLICNVGGAFYAIRDACTHDGGILGFGDLEGNLIDCPRHGAKFDVTTGEAVTPPAVTPLQTYALRIQGEHIEVGLEERRG
jgi:3-phenylpropionate/trans-cinnamate dioxygenase ferredoxin subunit